ncbi:MAG TPA: alpha/beta fold hydrolase [Candidatus Dormibacteraeota bacterium]|nr:alpha/beta fold hydrolase [Candidatus Dormibacteraeota bacterium]
MLPAFTARPPWLGPDLQTLRNTLRPPRPQLAQFTGERLELALADGSGDRLAAVLQQPLERRGPLAVLIHGLSGGEDSPYMLVSAAALLERGHPVLRLNLRGAGASRPLCRLQYHAGRTADLREALAALDPALIGDGLLALGFSLGGNMLLKFLAEHAADLPVCAAAAVSAPIDLAAAARRILMRRNRVYHWNLLRAMKTEATTPAAELAPSERMAIEQARNIIEFDDRFVAPRNGFAGAADYYARNSAERFLPAIGIPTLVVHALDDPWIPPNAYRRVRWADNRHLHRALSPGGGHVGFHARGSRLPWHDQVVGEFFAGVSQ